MIKSPRLSLPVAVLATMLTATAPVLANPPAPKQTLTVEYRDLNLTTTEGKAELQNRLRRAVKSVCAPAYAKQIQSEKGARACAREARASAGASLRQAIALAGSNRSTGG